MTTNIHNFPYIAHCGMHFLFFRISPDASVQPSIATSISQTESWPGRLAPKTKVHVNNVSAIIMLRRISVSAIIMLRLISV